MPLKRTPPSARKESTAPKPPTATLALLFAAFAGALVLKGVDERRTANAVQLNEARAQAIAGAEMLSMQIASTRQTISALLKEGASFSSVEHRIGLRELEAIRTRPAYNVRLETDGSISLFASIKNDRWVRAVLPASALIPGAPSGLRADLNADPARNLASIGPRAEFHAGSAERQLVACSPVNETEFNFCLSGPAPWLSNGDYYRIFIYGLLLAAPLLALYGLLEFAKVQKAALDKLQSQSARSRDNELTTSKDLEIPGLMGVWRWDSASRVLTLGKVAGELLGRNQSRTLTLTDLLSLVHEADRDRLEAVLVDADPFSGLQTQFRTSKAGPQRSFEMFGGLFEGVFSGALLDVSDRVAAQGLSRRAEAIARAALEAHPGPFAVWDSRKRLTHWNSAFQRVFNLSSSVLHVGASFDYVMAEVSKFVRVERPLGDDSKARELFLASEQWIRMIDRRTASDGLITVGMDITNLKTQEADLSRSERRLRSMVATLERTQGQAQELAERYAEQKIKAERASHAKSAFLANMSHELRTPLNAILGFSEMIANEVYGPLGDERYRGYATDILESGRHLLEMINDVLDAAKIEAGKMQIAPRPIDAIDAVDSAVRLIRRRASDKQVSLVFDHDDDLPDINGDHRAIKQMTLNLIANAIKFTEAGGRIQVLVRKQDPWLVISVADTGVGIPASDLPRIGQPFEQARSPDGQSYGGTGLGLAITKSFAEMHGGRLQIESEVGVGTTVAIYLPLLQTNTLKAGSVRNAAE